MNTSHPFHHNRSLGFERLSYVMLRCLQVVCVSFDLFMKVVYLCVVIPVAISC